MGSYSLLDIYIPLIYVFTDLFSKTYVASLPAYFRMILLPPAILSRHSRVHLDGSKDIHLPG